VNDIERIDQALRVVADLSSSVLPKDIVIRLKHGIPKQLSFLCDIPGIGPKKAWLLYTAGVVSPEKLKEVEKPTLITCLGNVLANKIWSALHSNLEEVS
jgi:DNA polymerase/3'-5' exonuclease PolX